MTTFQGQSNEIYSTVQQFYGKRVQSTQDFQTAACECTIAETNPVVIAALKNVPEEVTTKYYGCGSAFPTNLEGLTVLDLGSGSGRDCYAVAQLVGPKGKVIGIDMTDEQLDVARRNIPHLASRIGYTNLEFKKGLIEDIKSVGIPDGSIDLAISNCVVNLSPDKPRVFREVYDALRIGGEFYFSDVYVDVELPNEVRLHKLLWGECIAGALSLDSFQQMALDTGFALPRIVTARKFEIYREELLALTGNARFFSVTFRLFKLPAPQLQHIPSILLAATYTNSMAGYGDQYSLDIHTQFQLKKPVPVSSDTAEILSSSWLSPYFEIKPISLLEQVLVQAAPENVDIPETAPCCSPQ